MIRTIVALFLALASFAPATAADNQNRNLAVAAVQKPSVKPETKPEAKVALVIGNAAYRAAPLRNPGNDAQAVAAKLRQLGFDVLAYTDLDQKGMNRAITRFGEKVKAGGVALFYYAGHGMQIRGKNFLIPVDAEISSEASARSETVDLDALLEQLGKGEEALNIVILDACRNNPFERRFRALGGGLAQLDAPKGTLLAYATAPGATASDGDGANGLYTSEMLKALDEPGLKVEEVFKKVRTRVAARTENQQVPWEASSLTGDFYFRPPAQAANGAPTAAPAAGQHIAAPAATQYIAAPVVQAADSEREKWQRWQERMNEAFGEARRQEGSAATRRAAWDRFFQAYGNDNPQSDEDEMLRREAKLIRAAIADEVAEAASAAAESGNSGFGNILSTIGQALGTVAQGMAQAPAPQPIYGAPNYAPAYTAPIYNAPAYAAPRQIYVAPPPVYVMPKPVFAAPPRGQVSYYRPYNSGPDRNSHRPGHGGRARDRR